MDAMSMLSVTDAIAKILATAKPLSNTEQSPLVDSLGRVLAEDIIARVDVPPADNSAMDGYAVNTADVSHDPLPVSQEVAAGTPPQPLKPHTAARIFTGAEIPDGANAVIMQEDCERNGDTVRLPQSVKPGNNIRPCGQDIQTGQKILPRGRKLRPQDLGLLASIGVAEVCVYRRLKVAILSSGDELIMPPAPLKPGQIYNSNRFLLQGLLKKMGIDIVDMGIVEDSLAATCETLKQAAAADCIISTGGVSVGDKDFIKDAVDELGRVDFWRIALKPGKPLAFGHVEGTPFFGLPGNPSSVLITFLLFARPYIQAQQGEQPDPLLELRLPATFQWKANRLRQEYLRVRIDEQQVQCYPNQSSGVLSSASWANALAVIPPQTEINPGDLITVIPLTEWM